MIFAIRVPNKLMTDWYKATHNGDSFCDGGRHGYTGFRDHALKNGIDVVPFAEGPPYDAAVVLKRTGQLSLDDPFSDVEAMGIVDLTLKTFETFSKTWRYRELLVLLAANESK